VTGQIETTLGPNTLEATDLSFFSCPGCPCSSFLSVCTRETLFYSSSASSTVAAFPFPLPGSERSPPSSLALVLAGASAGSGIGAPLWFPKSRDGPPQLGRTGFGATTGGTLPCPWVDAARPDSPVPCTSVETGVETGAPSNVGASEAEAGPPGCADMGCGVGIRPMGPSIL
jgi:hypothetical protein